MTTTMTTTEIENKRQGLIELYSDYHKDAYGYRPKYNYSIFTLERLENDWNTFRKVCEENEIAEKEAENQAEINFEAKILSLINCGANDRKTALRWLIDSYEETDLYYGVNYVLYNLGLGFDSKVKNELNIAIEEYFKNKQPKM